MYMSLDYDSTFPNSGWKVGLKTEWPSDLTARIAAAIVSFSLGNAGIDGTYKRYTKNHNCGDNSDRIDREVSDFLISASHRGGKSVINASNIRNIPEWCFFMTLGLSRSASTFRQLVSLAHRGCFFESISIARFSLEVIAWTAATLTARDGDVDPLDLRAESSIGALNKFDARAGRLYGYLSEHAHWRPRSHLKTIAYHEGKVVFQFQSSLFKAKALYLTLMLLEIYYSVLDSYFDFCLSLGEEFVMPDPKEMVAEAAAYRARIAAIVGEASELKELMAIADLQKERPSNG